MRKLAIDYGKKRIGLSISDSGGKIALCLDTYLSRGMREDVDFIVSLVRERNVSTIVLGLPLNMDGSEGRRAALTRKFGNVLARAASISVEYYDERLTSVAAEEIMGGGAARGYPKGEVDKIAAMLILQAYLDKNNRE